MKFKYFFILIGIFLCRNELYAQYTPYFKNYSLSEFNAGNQNWGVSISEDGKLYVANNNGLLEFDGINWNFNELPNKTIIRSVLAHKDLIYTGSYEEFGYWRRNNKGKLGYTSLNDLIEKQPQLNEEFWQILSHKDAIIFRSFLNLYIYQDGKIITIKPESTIISIDIVDDIIYVSTLKHGIFILREDHLYPYINGSLLKDSKVISISNYKGKLLISTALKGCFTYSETQLTSWYSEINDIIKKHQLNSFSKLKNGDMIFGTIKNGVYVSNNQGKVLYHINKENGLLNNTVLCQTVDERSKLYVGLDNGLASVDLSSPYSFFNDNSGKLGAVYDIINYEGITYIGTNTGLFYIDKENKLQFIEESQGQVWSLNKIKGDLFCGHNNGTYLVKNKKLKKKISNSTGGWTIKKVPEENNTYIQGTYTGLVKYEKHEGAWHVKHLGEPTIPIKYLAFEDQYTAWLAHAYKGLFRVEFNENHDKIISIVPYEKKGLNSEFNVRVYKIKSDICFKTNEGWLKYESLIDSIVPFNLLNENFGDEAYLLSEENNSELAIKNNKDKIYIQSLIEGEDDLHIPSSYFKDRLIVGSEKISKINDSLYSLNLYGGFMNVNKKNYSHTNTLYKPMLENIKVGDDYIDIDQKATFDFPFKEDVNIAISSAKSSNHFFEYALTINGSLEWIKTENGKIRLSNLSNGDYTLHFRTANSLGDTSDIKVINFTVLPPWYKNSIGIALYGVTAILIILLFYKLHKKKIAKEQRLLEEKFAKEQEDLLKEKAIENEKKIVQLRNQSLKNEVKLKSKQLANTAMALVKKNESMLEIKEELEKQKTGFTNSLAYKHLLRKIDNSIGHEDEWEIFEYNFNQVHEEFFNQLKNKHPQLTHKDLKICAYIKMNLLTKEIAPLMNVSIRGLETHRYRLKRKLNLENDKSLGDYLRNFK
ncbi:helix-turn-helix and ligand-binding sensor domain-containing protein [Flavivirga algicola]|uniref:Transcriptional regulator n=1 Tax=Flavivirga algicola TaxID=2729136 RepID=A0ABX1RWU4_9FLAO|nr:transcriptional regulator [Flavivirga algicola]NMH86800.1 transcriptional regulator [Flavivirga algicola]